MWYHSAGITNILAHTRVSEEGHVVTYSGSNGNKVVVKKIDGTIRTFEQSLSGLFYLDTDKVILESVFINIVDNNKYKCPDKVSSSTISTQDSKAACKI